MKDIIIKPNDVILITGANGFVGSKVVEILINMGFKNLKCFVRPTSDLTSLNKIILRNIDTKIDIFRGNLLNPDDCRKAVKDSTIIYHLAAGMGKTFSDAYLNTVITTKRLLEASSKNKGLKRFVNVSSFSGYSNQKIKPGGFLDENCDLEKNLSDRHDPYCFAKTKQELLVLDFCINHDISYTILRPGSIFGPNVRELISTRVGINTFGIFFHLGGNNQLPLTYIDNCAEAIVLSGLNRNGNNQIFNIVDDKLPTSEHFLKQYKQNVGYFHSIYIPFFIFYIFSFLWEKYSIWSEGQFPPVFNRKRTSAFWKGNIYSNKKLKHMIGWKPRVPMSTALSKYFYYLKNK